MERIEPDFDFDCLKLPPGRLRSICEGTSGLPETGPGNTREGYIKLWKANGIPNSEPVDLSCVHRGKKVGSIVCAVCQQEAGKHVEVFIFACSLHEKCIPAREEGGIKCCAQCQDRMKDSP